jgi:hypothetical protein
VLKLLITLRYTYVRQTFDAFEVCSNICVTEVYLIFTSVPSQLFDRHSYLRSSSASRPLWKPECVAGEGTADAT